MLTKAEIQKLARAQKIDEYSLLREYFQVLLLKSFYEQPDSEYSFFKGGTAIKLLFGSFRFSEDLDFTTKASKERVEQLLRRALAKTGEFGDVDAGFTRLETVGNNFSFRFQFRNLPIPSTVFIKTDFSARESVLEPVSGVLATTLPITPLPIIKHLSRKELLAEKIRAVTHRRRGRDVFDLWYLLSRGEILDWNFTNRKLAYYHETLTRERLLARLNDFSPREIRLDLDKFLPENFRRVDLDLLNKIKNQIG